MYIDNVRYKVIRKNHTLVEEEIFCWKNIMRHLLNIFALLSSFSSFNRGMWIYLNRQNNRSRLDTYTAYGKNLNLRYEKKKQTFTLFL